MSSHTAATGTKTPTARGETSLTVARTALALASAVGCCLLFAAAADASQLIDRNAHNVTLAVDNRGEALLTYTARGQTRHVLAWGAINALPPQRDRSQVSFKLDYAGGYGKYRNPHYWQSFGDACTPYDGPALARLITACDAPDGSYWAVQAWQRELPDYGVTPTPAQAVWELRLSHWSGPPATLTITTDWAYRKYDHLFGTYSYAGVPVHGFKSTSAGVPIDSYGRNIFVDTYDSAYGLGWRRDNSFLTHTPKGSFCYGFYPHGDYPSGKGSRYRATAEGPGVTPDVMWIGEAPGVYDRTEDRTDNRELATLEDSACKPN